uniref:ABC transporter permease n=1 Tax=Corynebacterium provencense TaxID=1737425 RepID=UPI000AFF2C08|nr:FtsX-like permease family protein [Corynebacterium provencense]
MSASSTMRRVSLRSLAGHKVRLVLTVLAVVLGTAFISGALMFTASLQKTFGTLTESTTRGIDVVVAPADNSGGGLPLDLGNTLAGVDGVARVNISTETTVVVSRDGSTLQTGGAPSFAMAWYPPDRQVGPSATVVEGTEPRGDGEVVVNSSAARDHGITVGDRLTVIDVGGVHDLTVSGIYDIDIDGGGFLGLMMEEPAYVTTFTDGRTASGFSLSAQPGVSQEQLAGEVSAALRTGTDTGAGADTGAGSGSAAQVKTGGQVAEEQAASVNDALSFVNYFLVAFGLVALVVGTFIIANTFSMIVAQRTREFALLRSLGVSSGQLTGSVVTEAVVVGILGSLLGVAAGAGLTKAIYAVIGSTGAGLPDTGLQVTVGSVVLPLVLGVFVTVVSAWAPARRAGAVRPPVVPGRCGRSRPCGPVTSPRRPPCGDGRSPAWGFWPPECSPVSAASCPTGPAPESGPPSWGSGHCACSPVSSWSPRHCLGWWSPWSAGSSERRSVRSGDSPPPVPPAIHVARPPRHSP